MKRLNAVFRKIFFLRPLPTVLIAVPSFLFVAVMLGTEEVSALDYVSYFLSAYALIITVTGAAGVAEAARNGVENLPLLKKIRENPLGKRLLGDAVFRSEITLHGGLLANLLYVAVNLASGFRYRSAWFVSLAVYYFLLSAMRAVLVRHVHQKRPGQDLISEFRCYRACGVMLLLMNQALMGIVIYIVTKNRGFSYSGTMIYAMAAYAFYITISAVVNLVKYRKYGSPVLSAAKVISLTAALVSMLSLETAMISRFGEKQPGFRRVMTAASGGAVCVIVLMMAVFMIVRSVRKMKKLKFYNSEI